MSECKPPAPATPAERFENLMSDIFEGVARYNANLTAVTMHAHVCTTKHCPASNNLHREGAAIMDQVLAHIDQLRKATTEIRDDRLMKISEAASTNAN